MQRNKGNMLVAALFTILCFLSVVYASCTKTGNEPVCNGVVCLNQGYCNKGKCVCPAGYEGSNCVTASVAKYIGTWDVTETVTESTDRRIKGRTRTYPLFFKSSATPTTFFINNFLGKPDYNQVIAVLDSNNSFNFYLDTLRPIQMWFDQVIIRQPSTGSFNGANKTMNVTLIIRYLNSTSNWQVDNLTLAIKPHDF
jgi:hypothetical protein